MMRIIYIYALMLILLLFNCGGEYSTNQTVDMQYPDDIATISTQVTYYDNSNDTIGSNIYSSTVSCNIDDLKRTKAQEKEKAMNGIAQHKDYINRSKGK